MKQVKPKFGTSQNSIVLSNLLAEVETIKKGSTRKTTSMIKMLISDLGVLEDLHKNKHVTTKFSSKQSQLLVREFNATLPVIQILLGKEGDKYPYAVWKAYNYSKRLAKTIHKDFLENLRKHNEI